jgi:hypothetical protein
MRKALGPDYAARLDAIKSPRDFPAFMAALPTEIRQQLALVDAGAALFLSAQLMAQVSRVLPQIAIFDPDQEKTVRDIRQGLADMARLNGFASTAALGLLGIAPEEAQAIGADLVEAANEALGLPNRPD